VETERIILINQTFFSRVFVIHKKRISASVGNWPFLERSNEGTMNIRVVKTVFDSFASFSISEDTKAFCRGLCSCNVIRAHNVIVIVFSWGRSKLKRNAAIDFTNLFSTVITLNDVSRHQGICAAFRLRLDLCHISVVILGKAGVSLACHVSNDRSSAFYIVDLVNSTRYFCTFPGAARACTLNVVN